MLSDKERRRYARQIMLSELGEEGQKTLKQGRVLVVGAGGLGCPVLQYLTAAGTGTIGVVEYDMVSESNIHRQILYGSGDIGKLKSIIAKNILRNLNDAVNIEIFNLKLTSDNAARIFENYDIVIDATDNYETRYVIDRFCSESGKPMIHGAIYKYEGQVSVFNYKGGSSYSNYRPLQSAGEADPTPANAGLFGVLPGIAGTLMANEAIKIITGIGEVMSGKILIFNTKTNSFYTLSI